MRWLSPDNDDAYHKTWMLVTEGGFVGAVQQFGDGPYYGTWADGRTGAMGSLEECKARVLSKVRPQ